MTGVTPRVHGDIYYSGTQQPLLAGPAALGTVSFTYTPAPVARLLMPDTTAGGRPCSLGRFG